MFNALVAGAGPAGSTTALLLARARRSVCVYERSVFPRTKACGEYLSPRTVQMLHDLGVAAPLAPHARTVRGVRLHGHGVHARIDFPQPGWSLPRSVLDEVLLNAAISAGAKLLRGRVEDCFDGVHGARMVVRFPDGTLSETKGSVIVGADGIHSIVARTCGFASQLRATRARFALGGHYRGFARLDGYIDMFVDGPNYLAINPLSDDSANLMLIVEASELEAHRSGVDAFAEERARSLAGDVLANAGLEQRRIAIGPLFYRARRLAGRHVLLAGDAACFLDPFTGQGVYFALRCGQVAAECIVSGSLGDYERLVQQEIRARERSARSVARFIGSPGPARAGAWLLRRVPWVLQPLVNAVTGAA
jgi:flavin-dependent dehydrogenase